MQCGKGNNSIGEIKFYKATKEKQRKQKIDKIFLVFFLLILPLLQRNFKSFMFCIKMQQTKILTKGRKKLFGILVFDNANARKASMRNKKKRKGNAECRCKL